MLALLQRPSIELRLRRDRLRYLPRLLKKAPVTLLALLGQLLHAKFGWPLLVIDDISWLVTLKVGFQSFPPLPGGSREVERLDYPTS